MTVKTHSIPPERLARIKQRGGKKTAEAARKAGVSIPARNNDPGPKSSLRKTAR